MQIKTLLEAPSPSRTVKFEPVKTTSKLEREIAAVLEEAQVNPTPARVAAVALVDKRCSDAVMNDDILFMRTGKVPTKTRVSTGEPRKQTQSDMRRNDILGKLWKDRRIPDRNEAIYALMYELMYLAKAHSTMSTLIIPMNGIKIASVPVSDIFNIDVAGCHVGEFIDALVDDYDEMVGSGWGTGVSAPNTLKELMDLADKIDAYADDYYRLGHIVVDNPDFDPFDEDEDGAHYEEETLDRDPPAFTMNAWEEFGSVRRMIEDGFGSTDFMEIKASTPKTFRVPFNNKHGEVWMEPKVVYVGKDDADAVLAWLEYKRNS